MRDWEYRGYRNTDYRRLSICQSINMGWFWSDAQPSAATAAPPQQQQQQKPSGHPIEGDIVSVKIIIEFEAYRMLTVSSSRNALSCTTRIQRPRP